jgi:nucleoid DNA-binding protein
LIRFKEVVEVEDDGGTDDAKRINIHKKPVKDCPRAVQQAGGLPAQKRKGLLHLAELGVFRKPMKSQVSRNPTTGEQIKIPARTLM